MERSIASAGRRVFYIPDSLRYSRRAFAFRELSGRYVLAKIDDRESRIQKCMYIVMPSEIARIRAVRIRNNFTYLVTFLLLPMTSVICLTLLI